MVGDNLLFFIDGALRQSVRCITTPSEIVAQMQAEHGRWLPIPNSSLVRTYDQASHDDRPSLLLVDAAGHLFAVTFANMDGDPYSVSDRITVIDEWLSNINNVQLATVYDAHNQDTLFTKYHDLPNRRSRNSHTHLVVTPLGYDFVCPSLVSGHVEVGVLDVHLSGDLMTIDTPTFRCANPAVASSATIDLRPPPLPLVLEPGRTYDTKTLPSLFDPSWSNVASLDDAFFTAGDDLVLVAELTSNVSPLETPDRFRWDTTAERAGMFLEHAAVRPTHLFMESASPREEATYIGELLLREAQASNDRLYFDIQPSINPALWSLLRRGRLPALNAPRVAHG